MLTTQAILVGDMYDPCSAVSQIIHRDAVTVRRPEKGTRPKLYHVGADQVALDPLAARRPDGGPCLTRPRRPSTGTCSFSSYSAASDFLAARARTAAELVEQLVEQGCDPYEEHAAETPARVGS